LTARTTVVRFRGVKTPIVFLAAFALAACSGGENAGQDEAAVRTPPVLAGVPVIEGSQIVDTSGTSEAARVTLLVPLPSDSVAAFYRRRLVTAGWRIVGDVADAGGVDLYAERSGPPLWVHIRPGPQPNTTLCALIGAIGSPPAGADSAR
jgi:hypothetical protein